MFNGPNIVTSGLILALDAANRKSYPGSGTTWFDISGNNNNITLYNGVSYSNNFLFGDGVNDYGRSVNTLNLTGLSAITVICVFNTPATTNTGMLYEHTADWNTNNIYGGVSYGGFGLFANSNGSSNTANVNHCQLRGNIGYSGLNAITPDVTKYQYYTVIHDFSLSSGETVVYVNSNQASTSAPVYVSNNTSTFADDYFYLWSRGGGSSYLNASIGMIQIYNRALSAAEIQQNYNSTKSRFNL